MFKDIRKSEMTAKRPHSEDLLNKASIINMLTSEVIPIEKEKECIFGRSLNSTIIIDKKHMSRQHCSIKYDNKLNRYFISDLGSSAGTFLNHKILPKGTDHVTELQQEDVISFGYRNKITSSYQFILHSLPAKKFRLDYEQEILEARKEVEKYKKIVLEHRGEIVDIKNELEKIRNTSKTNLAEIQDLVKNVMDITHSLSSKAAEIIQEMARKIDVLKSSGNSNEQILSDEIKNQIYAQLKNEFQCSICLNLMSKATVITCGHTFCEDCIRKWKKKSNLRCPICRAQILSINNFRALDNFLTTFCDFMGAESKKEQ